MGLIISLNDLIGGVNNSYFDKVTIVRIEKDIVKYHFEDYQWINLGLVVSKELLKLPKEHRKQHIVDIVKQIIIDSKANSVVVDNIDLLFSPEYSLDVIKLFEQIGKNKRLVVVWGGNLQNGLLTYAEPGYQDYHCYDIQNYDIYCIKK